MPLQPEHDYSYQDPENFYTDAASGVLRNLANIKNQEILADFEIVRSGNRQEELVLNPITVSNAYDLQKIHKHLFQDVYSWAGDLRKVDIAKEGKIFFPVSRFETGFNYINNLLPGYFKEDPNFKRAISYRLAVLLDAINFLHPFREGNGRTQREFIRTLALQKGFVLNLNPSDSPSTFESYMQASINSDIDQFDRLIQSLMITI